MRTIGIDAGGTNTDGVLLTENGVERFSKIPSTPNNVESIEKVLQSLIKETDDSNIDRIVIGTTLILNSAVEKKMGECGCILFPGPGLNPDLAKRGEFNLAVSGYIDHRGRKVEELSEEDVRGFGKGYGDEVDVFAVVGKFSPRNSELEDRAASLVGGEIVSKGCEVSSCLDFPLRASTTVLNAKSKPVFNGFARDLENVLNGWGVGCPLYFVKSDGALLNLEIASRIPSITIKSGPAVSTLGLSALTGFEDGLAIDIGGTTTDIGVIEGGDPLMEEKLSVGGFDTTFSSIDSIDVALGGDSVVGVDSGEVQIMGERKGQAAAFGGRYPTTTDALHVLGEFKKGDRKRAEKVMARLAEKNGFSVMDLSKKIVEEFCERISENLREFLEDREKLDSLNNLTLLGGGVITEFILPRVAENLNCDYLIPKYSEVAGAVGCAVSRVSLDTRIHIDTAQGKMIVNDVSKKVDAGKKFSEEELVRLGEEEAKRVSENAGAMVMDEGDVQVKSCRYFNVVERGRVQGQICDIEAQVQPGISTQVNLEKLRGED